MPAPLINSPRLHTAAPLAAVVATLAFAAVPPPAVGQTCVGTSTRAVASTVEEARAAVLCLVNAERSARRMRALRDNARLRGVAQAHTDDMVRVRYFSHTASNGLGASARLRRSGYLASQRGPWLLGENLAWGLGAHSTPASAVRMWMNSPPHRANVLRRGFRDAGVGVSLGVPSGYSTGATFAMEYGARR